MSLTLHQVGYRYPRTSTLVLEDLSCVIDDGKVTAIIGPNAAGKTTLLRILAGVVGPTLGRATLGGQELHSMRPAKRAGRIAYLAQRPTLTAGFSVIETIALGRYAMELKQGAITRAMERVGVQALADRGFHTLSAGQQQRVMLARALAQLDPWSTHNGGLPSRYLIADEPTSALDPKHMIETLSLFRELAQRGIGVVTALHDLTAAARVADAAIAMGPTGKIAAAGSVSETLVPDILEPIYGVPFVVSETTAGDVVTPIARLFDADL
jgi:iron complex transport system ATP-binding protein